MVHQDVVSSRPNEGSNLVQKMDRLRMDQDARSEVNQTHNAGGPNDNLNDQAIYSVPNKRVNNAGQQINSHSHQPENYRLINFHMELKAKGAK